MLVVRKCAQLYPTILFIFKKHTITLREPYQLNENTPISSAPNILNLVAPKQHGAFNWIRLLSTQFALVRFVRFRSVRFGLVRFSLVPVFFHDNGTNYYHSWFANWKNVQMDSGKPLSKHSNVDASLSFSRINKSGKRWKNISWREHFDREVIVGFATISIYDTPSQERTGDLQRVRLTS